MKVAQRGNNFWVFVNSAGQDTPGITCEHGGSGFCCDPCGRLISRCEEREELLRAWVAHYETSDTLDHIDRETRDLLGIEESDA